MGQRPSGRREVPGHGHCRRQALTFGAHPRAVLLAVDMPRRNTDVFGSGKVGLWRQVPHA